MHRVTIILQVLLGLGFLFSGLGKITGGMNDVRDDLEIASWFWSLTAVVEIIGAAGLLASLKIPRLAAPAAGWLVALMVGAIIAHVRVEDFSNLAAPVVLLVLSAVVVVMRLDEWRGPEPGRFGDMVSDRS